MATRSDVGPQRNEWADELGNSTRTTGVALEDEPGVVFHVHSIERLATDSFERVNFFEMVAIASPPYNAEVASSAKSVTQTTTSTRPK